MRLEQFIVANMRVEGIGALKDVKSLAEGYLQRALNTVAEYDVSDDDAIINKLLALGPEGRSEAESRMRAAWTDVATALEIVEETRIFLRPDNLADFFAWSGDYRCPHRCFGEVDANSIRLGPTRNTMIRIYTEIRKIPGVLPKLT